MELICLDRRKITLSEAKNEERRIKRTVVLVFRVLFFLKVLKANAVLHI